MTCKLRSKNKSLEDIYIYKNIVVPLDVNGKTIVGVESHVSRWYALNMLRLQDPFPTDFEESELLAEVLPEGCCLQPGIR